VNYETELSSKKSLKISKG